MDGTNKTKKKRKGKREKYRKFCMTLLYGVLSGQIDLVIVQS